jgi:nucleotide-binding universal stress UspA family protein
MQEINHILVVSGLFENLRVAVRYGASLARRFGASLTVAHVVYNPYGGVERSSLPLPDLDRDYQALLKRSLKHIDDIIAVERERGVPIEVVLREGKTTEQILAVIQEKDIDLLVLTAHREGRVEHLLFDSNVELVRKMPCHILLVKMEPKPATYLAD